MDTLVVRLAGERLEEVPVSALRDGEVVLVRPGASRLPNATKQELDNAVSCRMIVGPTGSSNFVGVLPEPVLAGLADE